VSAGLLDEKYCRQQSWIIHEEKEKMIEEIKLRDFPWDKIPWALDESGNRYIPGNVAADSSVLLLSINGTIVAYLSYDLWNKVGKVDLHYVHTYLPYQKKGHATDLMKWVFEKYGSQYEMHAFQTSGVTENTLKRWGFRNTGGLTWIRKVERR